MEYSYKKIELYEEPNGNLYIIPSGKDELLGGTRGLDIVHMLVAPYSDEDLEKTIKQAFDECYSKKPDLNLRSSVIERFLSIKGYGKATEGKKSITISWSLGEGFKIVPWRKTYKPPKGHYTAISDRVIRLDTNLKPGEMAKAVREAIDIASI